MAEEQPRNEERLRRKLSSRRLVIAVFLLIFGFALGIYYKADWLPEKALALVELGIFGLGIFVGKMQGESK